MTRKQVSECGTIKNQCMTKGTREEQLPDWISLIYMFAKVELKVVANIYCQESMGQGGIGPLSFTRSVSILICPHQNCAKDRTRG